jgi:hypothetical protein
MWRVIFRRCSSIIRTQGRAEARGIWRKKRLRRANDEQWTPRAAVALHLLMVAVAGETDFERSRCGEREVDRPAHRRGHGGVFFVRKIAYKPSNAVSLLLWEK